MHKREAITASNLGPVVSVLTWIVQAAVAIAVGIKFTLSSIIPGKQNREDTPLFLATVRLMRPLYELANDHSTQAFGIGFTISISLAVPNGVGRHQETLSLNQLESLQKAIYAANILFVLVSACVQASVLILFHELTPNRVYKRTVNAMAMFVILSSTAFLFVGIFPCHPPRVWELLGAECIDQISFWKAFAAVNIVIESALTLFPVFVVYPLRVRRGRKVMVVSCFAARLM